MDLIQIGKIPLLLESMVERNQENLVIGVPILSSEENFH